MIARIEGILKNIAETKITVEVGQLWYEVMVPASAVPKMPAIDEKIILHTLEIIEGEGFGTNSRPRMIGFLDGVEKEFFQVFTTVSGLGTKKALKAMGMPVSDIASAIELANENVLKKLPEIGPKTAKKIIAELQGKMSKFALLKEPAHTVISAISADDEIISEALFVLTNLLHYSAKEADSLINLATADNQTYENSEILLKQIFKIRASQQK